jgi:hypothetical protein
MFTLRIEIVQDKVGRVSGKPSVSIETDIKYSEQARRIINAALGTAGVPSEEDDPE